MSPPSRGGTAHGISRGERRSNATHASTTDPDARLYRKARGHASQLCCMGHLLMENRNGLVVDTETTHATGTAEREAAEAMVDDVPGCGRITLGADKAFDVAGQAATLREMNVTRMSPRTQPTAPRPSRAARPVIPVMP